MNFDYYLSFGTIKNHQDRLSAAIELFSNTHSVAEWTPYLEGPGEYVNHGDIFINVGCLMNSELCWPEFKSYLKDYQKNHSQCIDIDIDLLIQVTGNLPTIISPKAVHYTHSIMLLIQLNSGLMINKRPIKDWYAGKGNVHDFSFNKTSFQIS
ncbi:MAG: hypothetical protein ACON35_02065 [Candidatus Marinamargulisbacteria bacterium]